MKKSKKAIIILCAAAVAAAVFGGIFLMARGRGGVDLSGNVCYFDERVFFGKNANFAVSVYSGRGEKNFLTDGKATDVESFCKIVLNVLNPAYSKIASFDCEVFFEDGSHSPGKIEKDPLTLEYTADIEAAEIKNVKSVYIKYAAAKGDSIDVKGAAEGGISAEGAFNAAVKVFSKEIKENTKNGGFDREIYVKFVSGYGGGEPHYWYVAFIASDSDYWAVLIDAKTGKTELKRG
jgi:hypothetical protein